MRLLAISDLHLSKSVSLDVINEINSHRDDWLILAGDIAENIEFFGTSLEILTGKFAKLIWVPGNHELYTLESDPCNLKGAARYEHFVELCQQRGVLTPEDPYPLWPGAGPKTRIVPMFIGYDYSFCPAGMTPGQARAWALEDGIKSMDEVLLYSSPHASREAWCRARVDSTRARLETLDEDEGLVLVNHYPLRYDLVRLFRIPRFSPWCGTKLTEDWHTRFRARVVVSGHLHVRATDWRDGVRFEEVSLGYPRHWNQAKGIDSYLREILPGPSHIPQVNSGPHWHR